MSNTYSLKKNGNTYLSPHFQVREFACKDGSDTILINPALISTLEKLFSKLGAKAINITSGYRTPTHSIKVGGYATDQHTKGNAADIKAVKKDGSFFSSKEITLALEDIGHAGGVGLINKNGAVHVDVRGKKCWFDETNHEKIVNSWYTYWGVSNPATEKINVEYQVYAGKYWLGWVENYNEKNTAGYAGLLGKPINAIRVGLSKGKIQYRAHTKGGKWYSWVTDYNTKNGNGYAGVLGKEIDMLQMKLVDLPGYAVEYRVSTVGGKYLPWVRNYNTTNSNGYAGSTGKPIDRVQIRIVKA